MRVAVSLLALFIVSVAATSLHRTVRGFYRLDFELQPSADGPRVGFIGRSSAARAGLQEGDILLQIDGRPTPTADRAARILAVGEHLIELARQGETHELVFDAPPPLYDAIYLARSAVALFALSLALLTLWRTEREEAATLVILAVVCVALATVPNRTAITRLLYNLIHRVSGGVLAFFLYRFFLIFPSSKSSRWLVDIGAAIAAAAAAATVLIDGAEVWWPPLATVFRGCFVTALLASVWLQFQRWRSAHDQPSLRRQSEWAGLGMLVGLAPYLGLGLLPSWLGLNSPVLGWIAVLAMSAIPIGLAAALTEYGLWDLEPISRDALSATVMVIVGGWTFLLLDRVLLGWGRELETLRNLAAFAAGVLMVILSVPTRRWMQGTLDRWLHSGRPSPRELYAQAYAELARQPDPEAVMRRLNTLLTDGLGLDRVAAWVATPEGGYRKLFGPADLADGLSADAAERPTSVGFSRRILLERPGRVLGLLDIGYVDGVSPLSREGHEVVEAFAAQVAMAIESAQLLIDLRQRAEDFRILLANTERIIASSGAGILVTSQDGSISAANARAALLLAADEAELEGKTLNDVLQLPRGWATELPPATGTVELSSRTEPPRRLAMVVSPYEGEGGEISGRVVVLQDVSEIRALEDRLAEQERLASLGRLAAGLAHEINTPLTGIASYAQILSKLTDEDDPRAEVVAKLEAQSFRVARLVANLRAMVRDEAAGTRSLDLIEALPRIAEETRLGTPGGDEIDIEMQLPDEPLVVEVPPGSLELALGNLVRNAVQASPSQGKLAVGAAAEGSDQLKIWIDDAGPGIPEAQRQKVFEIFFTTRSAGGGTGLGLAIARDTLRKLGGELRLKESPLGGTRAQIVMPRSPVSDASSS